MTPASDASTPSVAARILIAGCGYVGARLAALLVEDGHSVWGLSRHPAGLPPGVAPVPADVTDPASLRGLPPVDAVVYAVAPGGRTEAAYHDAYVRGPAHVLDALARSGVPSVRLVLVSSTGVYGHTDGRWVDEDTPPEPADPTARQLLAGEAVARERGSPGVVLRLGGIYGPGRTRTVRGVLDGRAGCPGAEQYGNRVHRDDAAGAIRHLLRLPDPEPVYLGVDRDPAPLRDVYRWIADRAGVRDPCAGSGGPPAEDEGRRGTSKRCSSQRLVRSGFAFRYPTFREGYAPVIDELTGDR